MSRLKLVWSWFAAVWAGSRFALVFICVLSVFNAVAVTAFPWLWQYVVDAISKTSDGEAVQLRELAGWMLAVGASQFVLYTLLQGARSIMNAKIEWRARARVFDRLSVLDPSFYRRWRAGDLVTRLTDDGGEKISWFLCSGIFRTLEASLILVVCLVAMVYLDPALTAWVVLPLPLLIVGQAAAQGALGRRFAAVQRSISGINDELTATFSGIRIVQACGLQASARRRFLGQAAAQRKAEVRAATVQQAVHMMYGWGWQAAVVALLLAGGLHVIDGRISVGQFVTFEGLVMTLVWPMFDVGMFVSKYKQTFVSLTRLQELMDEQQGPADLGGGAPASGALAVSDGAVTAGDGVELLADVELSVRPGQTLAVVGAVGAGKSILMQLLAGARRPSSGSVSVGGLPVEELGRSARRATVAYVPQDPVLLSATLGENILLGRTVPDEQLARALEISRLAQDMPAFGDGLQTRVGERGMTLSGGQQQRVALARALVGEPRVLLLDDATAALDADTEAAFWQQLRDRLPEVGAVVVTHRVATIQQADEVIVLEGGQIVQRGQHDDLVSRSGPFRRIYGQYEALQQVDDLNPPDSA